ncbi:MAG: zinc-dependent alcohol dehydrogenase family protein [Candidatus Cloacimonetes bacterium]|nr:zinc-dependent alcohol dehydrogenase family protein [Candidatus Cloacimonadota bacterium]
MRAMILERICDLKEELKPLRLVEMAVPEPGNDEVLIQVEVCGVCHTELDEIEGRTPPPVFPVILGHEVVGRIVKTGSAVKSWQNGDRVGVAWIYSACGKCSWCRCGNENLCREFLATGRDRNGGYAEYMIAPAGFVHMIPQFFSSSEAAPLLCAGSVGYRSLKLAEIKNGDVLGLTGFGASGHLVLQVVRFLYPESRIMVFARNVQEREFALRLGASWAGDTDERSPYKCRAIIDTTPAWKPVVEALANLEAGGRLVINAIRKESLDQNYLLHLDYARHLWQEKELKSVANVTRADVSEFLQLAAEAGIKPEVREYELAEANKALLELKGGEIKGAKILFIRHSIKKSKR